MLPDRFANAWVLWLLVLVPIVLLAAALRRRPAAVFTGEREALPLGRTLRARLSGLPALLRAGALALLTVAIARPQDVSGSQRTSTRGIAMQIVVDRSGSMDEAVEIDGEVTTRLDAVKRVVKEFVLGNGNGLEGRAGDLIGLIAFGTYADTVAPLVREHGALDELIDQITVADTRTEGSTAIGEAIALAAARLRKAEEEIASASGGESAADFEIKSKAIVLLTDGENNAGEITPAQAASLAAEWGIRVYAIGIGDERVMRFGGLQIPAGGGVDERSLRAIADRTGGEAWAVRSIEQLRDVYAEIDELEETEIEVSELTRYEERYHGAAAAAFALVSLEVLLAALVFRRLP